MQIELVIPNRPHRTTLDTEGYVIIHNPYIGPILTNGPTCVSIFARDDGFEGYIWQGDPKDSLDQVPENAIPFKLDYNLFEEMRLSQETQKDQEV